ncbi:MAG: enoyl-CoA hydratase/isomerase family protein [Desulfobacterales bacterium]|jgi:enoyl-CoA hydratase
MDFECLLYAQEDQTAVITLNRPKVLNAMNHQLWRDLEQALDRAEADETVKVVVVTGTGRAFSTGADLKESQTRGPEEYRAYLQRLQEVSRRIIRFPKPTIAAVNGYALGSGYELALACDMRIAAQDAKIGSPEARVTSSVTGGAFRLLQDLVGPGKAAELLFSAENIDGLEAARIGLVNRAVPPDQLMANALELAAKISANSSFSIRMMKKGLFMARGGAGLDELMDFEVEGCLACVNTQERQTSLDAFHGRKTKSE